MTWRKQTWDLGIGTQVRLCMYSICSLTRSPRRLLHILWPFDRLFFHHIYEIPVYQKGCATERFECNCDCYNLATFNVVNLNLALGNTVKAYILFLSDTSYLKWIVHGSLLERKHVANLTRLMLPGGAWRLFLVGAKLQVSWMGYNEQIAVRFPWLIVG